MVLVYAVERQYHLAIRLSLTFFSLLLEGLSKHFVLEHQVSRLISHIKIRITPRSMSILNYLSLFFLLVKRIFKHFLFEHKSVKLYHILRSVSHQGPRQA